MRIGKTSVEAARENRCLTSGDGGEGITPDHIPKGVDASDGGFEVGIHREGAVLAGGQPDLLKPQSREVGGAADGVKQHVGVEGGAIRERTTYLRLGTRLDASDCRVQAQIDPACRNRFADHCAQIVIEAVQHFIAAIDQRCWDAQTIEDARKFYGNIPAANNHRPFRGRGKGENIVRIHQCGGLQIVLCEGVGNAPGGDHHPFCLYRRIPGRQFVQSCRIGCCEARKISVHIDFAEQRIVYFAQAGDLQIALGHKTMPVKVRAGGCPAVVLGNAREVGKPRGIHHELLGYAPDIHACPAQILRLE